MLAITTKTNRPCGKWYKIYNSSHVVNFYHIENAFMVKKITALQNLDTSSFKQKINLLTEKKCLKTIYTMIHPQKAM